MPALSAMLIKTTISINIAQEELYMSDSNKKQEYLNNITIFFNNYSNKNISSIKIQTAKDPATKLTSQDSASQHNVGLLKNEHKQLLSAQAIKGNRQAGESTSKLLFLIAISEVMLIYISQTKYH